MIENNIIPYLFNIGKILPVIKKENESGPLSPKLFSIYVEQLIEKIRKTNLITEVNGIQTGVLMYADDLLLITDSAEKLRKVLKICENFGQENEIKFNPKKTRIMAINNKKREKCTLCNQEIEWVQNLEYLGVTITQNNKSNTHLQER
ncbi:RNA-directed DNA polymerase from mobile element jockey-like [Brachionus plicatilis]|uniref:RNA-directed DNA polymerase from mobile element jockey-like n=1 Tax=Brachionus plicatilis TaxID=10195 RepID=A0A3M7P985_BRAPC|nr:RNA-directed DNA polymerase from mobile element jockey-like [Brachionus plicatilis]